MGRSVPETRWLEIEPQLRCSSFQTSHIRFRDTFIFNGAISPDKVIRRPE